MKVHEIVKDVIETKDREIFRLVNKYAEQIEKINQAEKTLALIGWFAMHHGPDEFNGYNLHEMASHVSETSHPIEYDYAVAFVKILEESKKEVDE